MIGMPGMLSAVLLAMVLYNRALSTSPQVAECSGNVLERPKAIYLSRWPPSPLERQTIAQVLDSPSDSIAWEHSTSVEHFYGPGWLYPGGVLRINTTPRYWEDGHRWHSNQLTTWR